MREPLAEYRFTMPTANSRMVMKTSPQFIWKNILLSGICMENLGEKRREHSRR